jgi:hypothetical protein
LAHARRPARGGQGRGARDDLAQALGEGWEQALGEQAGRFGLLHPSAEDEARALAGLVGFRAPVELLAERIRVEARAGEPLAQQPDFLRDVPKVLRMLELLWRARPELAAGLPLAVDAEGRLVPGPLLRATDEIPLAGGLPLRRDLAHPAWAEGAAALDPKLAPPLPARRLLQALYEVSQSRQLLEQHPVLAVPDSARGCTRGCSPAPRRSSPTSRPAA